MPFENFGTKNFKRDAGEESYNQNIYELGTDIELSHQQSRDKSVKDLVSLLLRDPKKFTETEIKPGDFMFFRTANQRKELAEICESVADHLYNEHIPNILIADRSARPMASGLIKFWKFKHPEEPLPGIYFINPTGFKSIDQTSDDELWEVIRKCSAVGNDLKGQGEDSLQKEKSIVEEFKSVYHNLMEDKDQPLLLFDTCVHSGDSLKPVLRALKKSGIKKS